MQAASDKASAAGLGLVPTLTDGEVAHRGAMAILYCLARFRRLHRVAPCRVWRNLSACAVK